jgi:hypothetical protein
MISAHKSQLDQIKQIGVYPKSRWVLFPHLPSPFHLGLACVLPALPYPTLPYPTPPYPTLPCTHPF